uniref:Uncharacterized protein n=1 Tax=Rhizophora mucronata TaxID=61149 RepID=A0A2P2MUL6_RHIMU
MEQFVFGIQQLTGNLIFMKISFILWNSLYLALILFCLLKKN